MKKFVFVYYGGKNPAETPKEEMMEIMEKWKAWFGTIGENMVDGGNPLAPTGQEVSAEGSKDIAADMWPAKGYSIINAADMAAAVEVSKGCPIMEEGGMVRVYEAMPM